jgi:hypothetical protein
LIRLAGRRAADFHEGRDCAKNLNIYMRSKALLQRGRETDSDAEAS